MTPQLGSPEQLSATVCCMLCAIKFLWRFCVFGVCGNRVFFLAVCVVCVCVFIFVYLCLSTVFFTVYIRVKSMRAAAYIMYSAQ